MPSKRLAPTCLGVFVAFSMLAVSIGIWMDGASATWEWCTWSLKHATSEWFTNV